MLSLAVVVRLCVGSAVLAAVSTFGEAARILAVLPYSGYSHFQAFQPLLIELAKRGHDVKVFAPFDKPKDAPSSYEVIPLPKEVFSLVHNDHMNAELTYATSSPIVNLVGLKLASDNMCDKGLRHDVVREVLDSKEEFDLIFVEVFHTDCFLGFAHRFKAPVIGMSSHALVPWANERMGNPGNVLLATGFLTMSNRMNFFERLVNTVQYAVGVGFYNLYEWRRQDVVKEVFGPDTPPTSDLARNISLLFINSHETIHPARPLVPTIINVAGMHLPKPKPLSEELRTFVDGASEGLIYFNMGSLLRADSIPKTKVDALFRAFGQLKQRVLWKWEGPPPSTAPPNIRFMKWVPQFDVLQHPKTRLFISHAGMMGTVEAVHSSVPIIVIPMFGDQRVNAAGLLARGVARYLCYKDLADSEMILEALRDVLENPTYAEKAKRNSELFRDRPLTPLETAVYWSEFVIRHKGAPHLRPASADMPYYQLLMLDVIFVLSIPPLLLGWAVLRFCRSGRGKEKRD